jgi:hypothetical protein
MQWPRMPDIPFVCVRTSTNPSARSRVVPDVVSSRCIYGTFLFHKHQSTAVSDGGPQISLEAGYRRCTSVEVIRLSEKGVYHLIY